MQKLNANDEQYVRIALDLGSHIATAKKRLRGKFQEWCRDGRLVVRDLPGRGRFLSGDLELFLETSTRELKPLPE